MVAAALAAAAVITVHFVHSWQRMKDKRPEAAVTIPEGSTMYDIDRILVNNGVLPSGEFVAAAEAHASASGTPSLEGMLFPDTYDFYLSADSSTVVQKLLDTFSAKAEPLFAAAQSQPATGTPSAGALTMEQELIIASLVQKEVPSSTDMAIVAGILEKRLASSTFLNVDATICYAKQVAAPTSTAGCYPITAADLKMSSPYNTYLYKGLPPTPIGNPGAEAIQATLHPQSSTYLYYLSDPATGRTIYAVTLKQQEANQKKYLND